MFITLFSSLVLFTGVVGLAHFLAYTASVSGAPLFTLVVPIAAVVCAALVPALSNPVHALLCLLGLFAATALIYLSLGAEYLGLVFSLVYLGAVAILFLYVIMLLNVKDIMSAQRASFFRGYRYLFSGCVGLLLFAQLTARVQKGFQAELLFSPEKVGVYISPLEELTFRLQTDILGLNTLYGVNWPLFALITLILLIAMLGAIVLATGSVEESPTHKCTTVKNSALSTIVAAAPVIVAQLPSDAAATAAPQMVSVVSPSGVANLAIFVGLTAAFGFVVCMGPAGFAAVPFVMCLREIPEACQAVTVMVEAPVEELASKALTEELAKTLQCPACASYSIGHPSLLSLVVY